MKIGEMYHRFAASIYTHAIGTILIGIFWIKQFRLVQAGYEPEWLWILFVSVLTVWDLYEWLQRWQGKYQYKGDE